MATRLPPLHSLPSGVRLTWHCATLSFPSPLGCHLWRSLPSAVHLPLGTDDILVFFFFEIQCPLGCNPGIPHRLVPTSLSSGLRPSIQYDLEQISLGLESHSPYMPAGLQPSPSTLPGVTFALRWSSCPLLAIWAAPWPLVPPDVNLTNTDNQLSNYMPSKLHPGIPLHLV